MTAASPRPPTPPTNRLLAALPPAEAAQFLPQLTGVQLRRSQVLYELGEPITQVYFPVGALASLMVRMEDGRQIEMAAVGRDGLVRVPLVLETDIDGHQTVTQIAGPALRLAADMFREALIALPGLRRLLLRYSMMALTEAGQTSACNALHAIDERCARWLLAASDRVGADQFVLTQDFLAAMLGVRRPSVTVAAGMLQQAGLITYHRGQVTIHDRERLEEAACECYHVLVGETDRLLGDGHG